MVGEVIKIATDLKKPDEVCGQIKQRSLFTNKQQDSKELTSEIIGSECMNKGYRIVKSLGSGAYAKVKLGEVSVSKLARYPAMAEHLENGNLQVAVKIIQKKIVPPEFLRKFLPRELDNHIQLPTHPHVVRCFEHFSSQEFTYIVMEYMCNGDLLDLINQSISRNQRGLGDDMCRKFFKQILYGLQHIHNNGIAHRDMKCENILIDENFDIKITDFGFSCKFAERETLLRTSCGSYAYTAPEVIKNEHYVGIKADVWSLGIILCAMMNGRLPYNDGQLTEMDADMKFQKIRFERNVAYESVVLVRKLLQYNPRFRPPIEDILDDPWLNGKQLIPRQDNKPRFPNPYSSNKGDGIVRETAKLRVDGSNLRKPSSPVGFRATSPNKTRSTPTGTDSVMLSKAARETIILKSRRPGNGFGVSSNGNDKRPKTWPKAVKEQAEKSKSELRTLSDDPVVNERMNQLANNNKQRARTKMFDRMSSRRDVYRFLKPDGNIEPRPPSPMKSKHSQPTAPNPSPCTSPSPYSRTDKSPETHMHRSIKKPGFENSWKKGKGNIIKNQDYSDSPDLDMLEVDMVAVKGRIPPGARSKSVPSSGIRQRNNTPAERAKSCRERIMHAYNENKTKLSDDSPLLPLMVQKIGTGETKPEMGLAFQAPYRVHVKTGQRASSPDKHLIKTIYKYKYH